MKHLYLSHQDLQSLFEPNQNTRQICINESFCTMQLQAEQIDEHLLYLNGQVAAHYPMRVEMQTHHSHHRLSLGFMLSGNSTSYMDGWLKPQTFHCGQMHLNYTPSLSGYSEFQARSNNYSGSLCFDLGLFESLIEQDPRPKVKTLFEPIFKHPDQPHCIRSCMTPQITQAAKTLQQQISIGLLNGFGRRAIAYELLQLAFDQIVSETCRCHDDIKLSISDIVKLEQVKRILDDDIQSPPTLKQLAKLIGLNEFKLKKGFKQLNQKTVFEYLHDIRMQRAARLLSQTHQPIIDIAQQVGFNNHGHFSVSFRQYFNQTPSVFRKLRRA